jgi:phytoene dehydrogenase-like protein
LVLLGVLHDKSLDTNSTPNAKIFICTASTSPSGGVHGMNGFYAAKLVLKLLKKNK